MSRIYYPGEIPQRGYAPHLGGIFPGTPPPTIIGNPHLRGGPFTGLDGYGIECADAATNLVTDPDFPDLTNWTVKGSPSTEEVGSQFAMDQGEFYQGCHIVADAADEGQTQAITISDSTDYTWSIWIYAITGTIKMRGDKGASYTSEQSTSKINEWERLVVSDTSDSTAGGIEFYSTANGDEYYAWMPQVEQSTYETPARYGAQPASCIYTSSPISESQTPWNVVCIVTPDWDYDAGSGVTRRVFRLHEGTNDYVEVRYNESDDKWYLAGKATSETTTSSVASTHSRGDEIHLAVTCDGYNAYLYIDGTQSSALAIKSVQPTQLILGASSTAAANALNGVIDDFAFVEGSAIPEFRIGELFRAFKNRVPLHGLTDWLT